MMKAVAIPYIIAILLGVGVIGLIGYWLFVSGGQFGGSAGTQQCRDAQLQYCNQRLTSSTLDWATFKTRTTVPTGCNAPSGTSDCESLGVKIKP